MYITKHHNNYILWSDKRKIIRIDRDKNLIYSYMNILTKKRNDNHFDSWFYMCCKYNIALFNPHHIP